jgi:hypothetical protein
MIERFVSARGADSKPTDLDVRYRKAVPTFAAALEAKSELDPPLSDEQQTIVIYRLSYDAATDEFYWTRQTDLRPGQGNQKTRGNEGGDEPEDLAPLSYELYSVPVSALARGQEFELNQQVRAIADKSGTIRPGKGSP